MKLLLTGGTGFIGRHCIAPLLALGYDVHAVSSHPVAESAGITWHKANLLDAGQVYALMEKIRPSHLLHLAWYAVPGKYWTSIENLRWVSASLALLEAFSAVDGKKVVMAGTCAEYEWNGSLCREGETPCRPATLYGTCKHALQEILMSWARQAGLSAAWGRVFSLYGPHENPARLVSSLILSLLSGERGRCGNGELIRDYLHVADVASAFVHLMHGKLTGPVNIGSGEGVSLGEIAGRIGVHTGRADLLDIDSGAASSREVASLVADVHQLRESGWSPSYGLDDGLKQTVDWWRTHLATYRTAESRS